MSGPETIINDVEIALAQLIQYGLGRKQQRASLAALAADPMLDGLRYVPGSGVFEWVPFASATPDGTSIVASSTQSAGRWVKLQTSWAYGAGGQNLGQRAAGYLLAVETYDSDDIEAMLERVLDRTPAALLRFTGDAPASDDIRPGHFYKDKLEFVINIITNNLRGGTAATQGSPVAQEAADDPGAHRIIGDLRRLICGVSPDFGIEGVERVEIGAATRIDEDQDRRLFTYAMAVTVSTSWSVEDEDLVDPELVLQPALTDFPAGRSFDPDNYVALGCGLVEGLGVGFDRTVEAGMATVAGVTTETLDTAVTFTPDRDTYRDVSASGIWVFAAVVVYEAAPPIPAGYLRTGMTRTDDVGVVADVALCSYSIPFGQPLTVG